jgi:hypothetical protein
VRRAHLPAIAAAAVATATLLLSGCGGDDAADDTTTTTGKPASQFGSSMGTEAGDVTDVAALGDGPAEGQVWQVPVGLSICGRFLDVPAGDPVNGVTAGPATTAVEGGAGEDVPSLGDFAESAGIGLEAGRLTLPDDIVPPELDSTDPPTPLAGATLATGDLCGDTPAEVQVWVYSSDARRSGDGILVVTQDLGNVTFAEEGMAMVIAVTPESSLPTLPPSALGG